MVDDKVISALSRSFPSTTSTALIKMEPLADTKVILSTVRAVHNRTREFIDMTINASEEVSTMSPDLSTLEGKNKLYSR